MKKLTGYVFRQALEGHFMIVLNEECDVMWIHPTTGKVEVGHRDRAAVETWPHRSSSLIVLHDPHE